MKCSLPIHLERGTTSTTPTQRVCANALGERRPGMETRPAAARYRRDLGDGLIVRWSTMDDAERLAHLFGTVGRNSADEPINPRMQEVMRRHVRGGYPLVVRGYSIRNRPPRERCDRPSLSQPWACPRDDRAGTRPQRGRKPPAPSNHRYSELLPP